MKYFSTKIPTVDVKYATEFYTKTLGLKVSVNYGHSVLLEEHLLLTEKLSPSLGRVTIYLETEDYNETEARILAIGHSPDFKYSRFGQRIMVLRDPSGNLVEIGESMTQIVSELLTFSNGCC